MREIKKCSYCDKTSEKSEIRFDKDTNSYVCPKHRSQLKNYGEIIKRTYRDRNEIVEYDNYAEIVLYNSERINPTEKCRTLIDLHNVDKCKGIKWGMTKAGYVVSGSNKMYLHQFILGKKEGFTIDHKDINPLNNLEVNLRHATKTQQRANTNVRKKKKGKYKGVFFRCGKWDSKIRCKGVTYRLGRYEIEHDAKLAYDKKALELFGEFANLN